MFAIQLDDFSNDASARVTLELTITHSDVSLFHVKYVICLEFELEDGLCLKDYYSEGPEEFTVIANSLFSEKEMKDLSGRPRELYFGKDEPTSMQLLQNQLNTFINDVCFSIEFIAHIPEK